MADEEKGKTAVEWFFDRLPIRMKNYMAEDYKQAVDMERVQMKESFDKGRFGGKIDTHYEFDQYYEGKYGKHEDSR